MLTKSSLSDPIFGGLTRLYTPPCRSASRSVGWSVDPLYILLMFLRYLTSPLLPKCCSNLKYSPCPPARGLGNRVSGLVIIICPCSVPTAHPNATLSWWARFTFLRMGEAPILCFCFARGCNANISASGLCVDVKNKYQICHQILFLRRCCLFHDLPGGKISSFTLFQDILGGKKNFITLYALSKCNLNFNNIEAMTRGSLHI